MGEQTSKVSTSSKLSRTAAAARDESSEVDAKQRRSAAVEAAQIAGDAGL